jgi:hypothetical protein
MMPSTGLRLEKRQSQPRHTEETPTTRGVVREQGLRTLHLNMNLILCLGQDCVLSDMFVRLSFKGRIRGSTRYLTLMPHL